MESSTPFGPRRQATLLPRGPLLHRWRRVDQVRVEHERAERRRVRRPLPAHQPNHPEVHFIVMFIIIINIMFA